MLVLKGIFGGSPKITLQNGKTRKVKNNLKRFLGKGIAMTNRTNRCDFGAIRNKVKKIREGPFLSSALFPALKTLSSLINSAMCKLGAL